MDDKTESYSWSYTRTSEKVWIKISSPKRVFDTLFSFYKGNIISKNRPTLYTLVC